MRASHPYYDQNLKTTLRDQVSVLQLYYHLFSLLCGFVTQQQNSTKSAQSPQEKIRNDEEETVQCQINTNITKCLLN